MLDVFEFSSRGGRSYNEDTADCRYDSDNGIFVVADGLGGHSMGELASACVAETIISSWNGMGQDTYNYIKSLVSYANDRVLALQKEKNTVMKSTLAMLAIEGRKSVWANSGDSRVYFFHQDALHDFTEDHSVAYKKYKAGEISRDMIGTDEDQSRLLKTIGSDERFEPDVKFADIELLPGDAFLLCSDGVWEFLKDEEILIDLFKAENAERWAELLLTRVMERVNGENDNLSLITIIVH